MRNIDKICIPSTRIDLSVDTYRVLVTTLNLFPASLNALTPNNQPYLVKRDLLKLGGKVIIYSILIAIHSLCIKYAKPILLFSGFQ